MLVSSPARKYSTQGSASYCPPNAGVTPQVGVPSDHYILLLIRFLGSGRRPRVHVRRDGGFEPPRGDVKYKARHRSFSALLATGMNSFKGDERVRVFWRLLEAHTAG